MAFRDEGSVRSTTVAHGMVTFKRRELREGKWEDKCVGMENQGSPG